VEKDWHTEKEFTYQDKGWNGKEWVVAKEQKPESDSMWTWATKRIG